MSAFSENFPWPNSYGQYRFFEGKMQSHGRVAALTSEVNGIYMLTRRKGDTLRIFVCECYAFGVAEYIESVDKIGHVDVVIIASVWCGYSDEAKKHCRDENVGLFSIGELMGALHQDDYWAYLTQSEKEELKRLGRL